MLFSTYGPVLDVVALKTAKMRGQAHIVFRDVQASSQAMRALQDFEFFGKKMVSVARTHPGKTRADRLSADPIRQRQIRRYFEARRFRKGAGRQDAGTSIHRLAKINLQRTTSSRARVSAVDDGWGSSDNHTRSQAGEGGRQ